MSAICVERLDKRFGEVVALQAVDLLVGSGEIVALLGANGAGKSTLLRILATTVLPDAGHALVAGHDVVSRPSRVRSCLGLMLGDERSSYWRLTGRQNLEFFAVLNGLRRRAARARTTELLEAVDLVEACDRRVGDFSAGMRARLSLARALIGDPPVLLLDEPTQHLDPAAAAGFRDIATRLARDRDAAVLFTTHNLQEAAAVATRAVLLRAGEVVFAPAGKVEASELERAFLAAV